MNRRKETSEAFFWGYSGIGSTRSIGYSYSLGTYSLAERTEQHFVHYRLDSRTNGIQFTEKKMNCVFLGTVFEIMETKVQACARASGIQGSYI